MEDQNKCKLSDIEVSIVEEKSSSSRGKKWVEYDAKIKDKEFLGAILVDLECDSCEAEVIEFLAKNADHMIDINSVSLELKALTLRLYYTENDMVYVDEDDEDEEITEEVAKRLKEELGQIFPEDFKDTYEFNGEFLITLWTNFQSIFNFANL